MHRKVKVPEYERINTVEPLPAHEKIKKFMGEKGNISLCKD
jgi:hypothetical protein